MKRLSWLRQRITAMTPGEVAYRAQQAVRERGRVLETGRGGLVIREPLPELPSMALPQVITIADRQIEISDSAVPDWHWDQKSAARAPRVLSAAVPLEDRRAVGNLRTIRELNRFLFIVPMALRYAATGDERECAAIIRLIADWIANNPRHVGINWTSPLEASVRILNWGIALNLCRKSELIAAFRPSITHSVGEHADFIRHSLSLHSSANHRLLGELVGLLASAAFFPEIAEAHALAEFAHHKFVEELGRQVYPDGVTREQSVGCHILALEFALTAAALLGRLDRTAPAVAECVRAMATFLDYVAADDGRHYAFGDDPSFEVTGLNVGTDVSVCESLFWSASAMCGDARFEQRAAAMARARGAEPVPDFRTAYWHDVAPGGPSACSDVAAEANPRSKIFADGGFAFLSRQVTSPHGDATEFQAMLKAGPFGFLSTAAHAHADQLMVCARLGATPLLIDSGSPSGEMPEKWIGYFKGTGSHNTVLVDGLDQSELVGPYLWRNHASGRSFEPPTRQHGMAFSRAASHAGYRRLGAPVEHSRLLDAHSAGSSDWLSITDVLKSGSAHTYELMWNLGPGVSTEATDATAEDAASQSWLLAAWALVEAGATRAIMIVRSEQPFRVSMSPGDSLRPAGWYCPTPGHRIPIWQMRFAVSAAEWEVTTTIAAPETDAPRWKPA